MSSFNLTRIDRGKGWYGYEAEFVGVSPEGVPYQKIANMLNYGREAGSDANHKWGAISGTHFISVAVKKLKGMDDRIEARIAAKLAKRTE